MTRRFRGPFPAPRDAGPEGVVISGPRPDPRVLLAAYGRGIFPWPHPGYPRLWFSPDPRFVLRPEGFHLPRSLAKVIRSGRFEVRADTAFAAVLSACARIRRPGQVGTWITAEMRAGYTALHHEGYAHSIEAWRGGRLVGGLYGVSRGAVFFGESMFALEPEASKVCFATLVAQLRVWRFQLIDCQSYTAHLERFGARAWCRPRFLTQLARALQVPTRRGPWTLALSPAADRRAEA